MRKSLVEKESVLLQFDPLVHKTLARMGIRSSHLFYEDYAQELRLKMLELYQKFDGNPVDTERYQFVAYASKGLYWYLLDILKKERPTVSLSAIDFETVLNASTHQAPYQSQVNLLAFMTSMQKHLTLEEQGLFWLLNDSSLTLKDIAQIYDISIPAIHKRKVKLQEKLSSLKNILKF